MKKSPEQPDDAALYTGVYRDKVEALSSQIIGKLALVQHGPFKNIRHQMDAILELAALAEQVIDHRTDPKPVPWAVSDLKPGARFVYAAPDGLHDQTVQRLQLKGRVSDRVGVEILDRDWKHVSGSIWQTRDLLKLIHAGKILPVTSEIQSALDAPGSESDYGKLMKVWLSDRQSLVAEDHGVRYVIGAPASTHFYYGPFEDLTKALRQHCQAEGDLIYRLTRHGEPQPIMEWKDNAWFLLSMKEYHGR